MPLLYKKLTLCNVMIIWNTVMYLFDVIDINCNILMKSYMNCMCVLAVKFRDYSFHFLLRILWFLSRHFSLSSKSWISFGLNRFICSVFIELIAFQVEFDSGSVLKVGGDVALKETFVTYQLSRKVKRRFRLKGLFTITNLDTATQQIMEQITKRIFKRWS